MTECKEVVSKEETFDKLELRLGKILDVQIEPTSPKKAYRITAQAKAYATKDMACFLNGFSTCGVGFSLHSNHFLH